MAYLWMLLSAISFATMGALAHALRDSTSWEVIAFARSAVVLSLSVLIVSAAGVKLHFWSPWQLWARSIAGSISMLFVFYSLTRLPVSIVVTLMNMAPVWVAIATYFLFPKTRSWKVWIAIAVGVVGIVLIQQPQLAAGNYAVWAPLVASVLLAVVMLALHQVKEIDHRAVVLHFAITAFVTSFAVFAISMARAYISARSSLQGTPLEVTLHVTWDSTTVLMLLATGATATMGQLFLTLAFAAGAPEKVSVVGLTQVGFAMCYDIALGGHGFDATSLFGILLIVAPTGWLLYVERRQLVEE